MRIAKIDLNAGSVGARPVVNVELWDEEPDDDADFAYREAPVECTNAWTWDGSDLNGPPATLDELKAAKRGELEAYRVAELFEGVTINGIPGVIDDPRLQRLSIIATGLLEDEARTTATWDPTPGSFVTISRSIFLGAYRIIQTYVEDVNAHVANVLTDINAAADEAAVEAIDVATHDGGWPEHPDEIVS